MNLEPMDHRLGFPSVLQALFPSDKPQPARVPIPPRYTPEQDAAAKEEDAKAMAGSNTPPAKAVKRDEPYRPDGFDFVPHNYKGQDGEVIKGREPAKFEELLPTDEEVMAAVRAAHKRGYFGFVAALHTSICGDCSYTSTPPHLRAKFIARCNALA